MRRISSLLLCALAACAQEGAFFFVESAGAVMPVWVRGDLASGTYVLFLHGGPGDSGQVSTALPAFQALEKDYAVVYWDQRGAGSCQGSVAPETFTLEQYVADADAVIRVIRDRFNPEHFFLFGHSWGGMLGTAYLTEPAHQVGIDGFVFMDGGHDNLNGLKLTLKWVRDNAQAKIDAGDRSETWPEAVKWVDENPTVTHDNMHELALYVQKLGGYMRDPSRAPGVPLDHIFLSPSNSFAEMSNASFSQEGMDVTQINLTEEMVRIRLPVLLLWGRYDGILPVELASLAYDAFGTPPDEKEIVLFEDSAHSPHVEEPEKFRDAVTLFINTHR